MLQRTKYMNSEDCKKYKPNITTSFQSSKYHHKKKSGVAKKSSNPWKKKNSSKNWNKENDPNFLNYNYYYFPKEKKEKNNFYNSSRYNNYYQKNEKSEKFEKNKNDKKISFDNDATTQSNSSSHEHEETNYDKNIINNKKGEDTINNIHDRTNNNSNKEEYNVIDININNKDIEIKNNNNIILNTNIDNINNIILNSFKNLNLNSNQNSVNNNNINKKRQKYPKKKKSISSELKKSFSDNIAEPYNKFNSINGELSQSINPLIENTEILNIKVKIEKDKYLLFKLRRFDDLFLTVKLFCEINNIEEKLMKPIITMILCGLNSIYQVFNTTLEKDNIKILQLVKSYNNIDI